MFTLTQLFLYPDPFVKVQLVTGLKLMKTKKTSFMRGTIDPCFNESFSFRVPQEELCEVSLVFTGIITLKLLSSTIVFNLDNNNNNKKCFEPQISILEWFLKGDAED